MRILSLFLCILLVLGCMGCKQQPQQIQSVLAPKSAEPYRVGLQTASDGYVRLSFATLISYDWKNTGGQLPQKTARQYAQVELVGYVTEIFASHTDGSVTLSLSDDVERCEIYRWKPSTPDSISQVSIDNGSFSLRSDGGIYIYEIIATHARGSATYLFLEMP